MPTTPAPGYATPPVYGGVPATGTYPGAVGAPGYAYRSAPPTNSLAIVSLVLGAVSILFCMALPAPIGLWLGLRARKEIANSGGTQGGDGLALAGVIVNGIGTALLAIGILSLVAIILVASIGGSN